MLLLNTTMFVGTLMIMSQQAFAAGSSPLAITSTSERAATTGQRSVYMNGVDISSARNQDLRNVHLRVDEHGNLFITAPHYQVTEEETFTPLSSYKHSEKQIEHKLPQERSFSAPQAAISNPSDGGDSALTQPVPVKSTDNGVKTVLPEQPQSPTK